MFLLKVHRRIEYNVRKASNKKIWAVFYAPKLIEMVFVNVNNMSITGLVVLTVLF